ncbi:ankyrin repeat-containing protein BDA1-like [Syzygium oleosum]|uniref:ankyrin repeat-containing protein BDA1-like n=1 Tax=Syzygium oleosum TaxID=219896 RepID=UPI0024BB6609|nr:ankyrin repeat-containing protein BDA1-like [Syzygium oleosum]
MERKLIEAAQKGNLAELDDLIRSNGLILEEMALKGGHTLLHVACVAGELNFVRELLKLKPQFVEIVNADGFSPLHIAAAQGHVEIARELLGVGQHLCSVKGRERRIPLHYAVVNGKLHVMKVLLSFSPESVEKTTARGETALHLAVKNNRFDAFVMLVEHLKLHKKEQVINLPDNRGNTVLHVAVAAQNFEVVDFMLCGHALKFGIMKVNALNNSGSTPLDVSPRSDREIREILLRAGAIHGQSNLPSSEIELVHRNEGNNNGATSYRPLSPPRDSYQGQESLDDKRNDLLVVAALIVTATFQAVIQPPTLFKKFKLHTKNGLLAAFSSFATSTIGTNFALCTFLSSNTFGFFLSVQIIIRLTKNLPLKWSLMLSMFSMVLTYLNCMANVPSRSLLDEDFSPQGAALIFSLATLIPVALLLLQNKITRLLGAAKELSSRVTS